MKYFVKATRWSEEDKKQIQFIAGEFNEYSLARIFKDAYNEHYRADACIVDEYNLVNK